MERILVYQDGHEEWLTYLLLFFDPPDSAALVLAAPTWISMSNGLWLVIANGRSR